MKSLIFKVSYDEWNAELQLSASATLESLAATILDAAGFAMDHCFGFYDNLEYPYHSNEEYTLFADMGEADKPEDTGVRNTRIESVFTPGKTMIFLFDYGDDWWFPVTCMGEAESRAFKKPKILSTTGTPPEQYPDYEDDD
ncbi:MAG: hypothetical protein QM627_14065 [Luteolibacter sp.]